MQMAAWQELTFSCLSVQAAPLAASRWLRRVSAAVVFSNPKTCSAPVSWNKTANTQYSNTRQTHNKYWLFPSKIWLQLHGHRAIKYRFKCLVHTKEAIIIERRFIWTINSIIACCRSVYKSMRPILSQRERGGEGNKGCTGDSVRMRRVKRRPRMFKGFKRTAYGTARNDKLEAHRGVSEEKISALMPTWAKKKNCVCWQEGLESRPGSDNLAWGRFSHLQSLSLRWQLKVFWGLSERFLAQTWIKGLCGFVQVKDVFGSTFRTRCLRHFELLFECKCEAADFFVCL